MTTETDMKLQVLEEIVSYPNYKEEVNCTAILDMDEFNYDLIEEKIKTTSSMTNPEETEGADVNLVHEILKLLDMNKKKYKLDKIGCIGFYWRGFPVLIIKMGKDYTQKKLLYVPIKTYKRDLDEKIANKKLETTIAWSMWGFLIVGGVVFGAAYVKSKMG